MKIWCGKGLETKLKQNCKIEWRNLNKKNNKQGIDEIVNSVTTTLIEAGKEHIGLKRGYKKGMKYKTETNENLKIRRKACQKWTKAQRVCMNKEHVQELEKEYQQKKTEANQSQLAYKKSWVEHKRNQIVHGTKIMMKPFWSL